MVVKFGHLQKKSRVPFWKSLPKFDFEKILIFFVEKKKLSCQFAFEKVSFKRDKKIWIFDTFKFHVIR